MIADVFVSEILCYFIGFLMLAAATGKLRTFTQFRSNLDTSFGLGPAVSVVLAPAVVAAEFVVAALVLGLSSWGGMLASLLMFCAFTIIVSYKFFTQSVVKCSCFGEAGRSVSGFDLLRNVLVIVSIAVYLSLAGGVGLPLEASILAAGLASILCVVAIEFHGIASLLVTK